MRSRLVVALAALALAGLGCSSNKVAEEAEHVTRSHHAHGGAHADPAAQEGHGHAHRHSFGDPDRYAERWDDPARDAYQKPDEILGALELTNTLRVVDLGAGTGYLSAKLAAQLPEGEVIAIDVSEEMVSYLTERFEREGLVNASARRVGFADPALEGAGVDRIVTLNTWHHIEGREGYAAKLAAALPPGGIFLVVDFEPGVDPGEGPPEHMRLSSDQVRAELESAGFVVDVPAETMPRHYLVRGRIPEL